MCHHQSSRCFCGATLFLKTARCAAAKPDHSCAFPDPVTISISNVGEDRYHPCCADADAELTPQTDEEPILTPQSDEERILPRQPDEGPIGPGATTAVTLAAISASLDILHAALFVAQEDGLIGLRGATSRPVEDRGSNAHAGVLRALQDAQRNATAVLSEVFRYRIPQRQDVAQETLFTEAEEQAAAEAQAEVDAMNTARAAGWTVRPPGAEFREAFDPTRDYGWSARRPRW